MKFSELRLAEPILRALASEGYATATPIQSRAIPPALEGRDVLGCAQTGTGKTGAFALPILQRLLGRPVSTSGASGIATARRARCLVLCPTRELATQIADSFRKYGRHLSPRIAVIFGGVSERPQIEALHRGVDIVVATPGRLLDLIRQGQSPLGAIETLVLDEADRMLDMGFINDIRQIIRGLPQKRQTMLFSATMPTEIRKLADTLLRDPVAVQVAPVSSTADRIDESVYFVQREHKPTLLAHLVDELAMSRTLVFTRTKHGADRVVRHLHKEGIAAEAIHGNKNQNARRRAMDNFRSGKTPILVATDIASRGIDVDGITHVVNYDLTHEPETYVHRIGRTARAGASGSAVSFCDREEMPNLEAIQRLIRRPIPVRDDHPVYPKRQESHREQSPREQSHRAPSRREPGNNDQRRAAHPAPRRSPGRKPAGKPFGMGRRDRRR